MAIDGNNNAKKQNQAGDDPQVTDPLDKTSNDPEAQGSSLERDDLEVLEEDTDLALSDESFDHEEQAPETLKNAKEGDGEKLQSIIPDAALLIPGLIDDTRKTPAVAQETTKERIAIAEAQSLPAEIDPIAEVKKHFDAMETTDKGDQNREKLKTVASDLTSMVGQLPVSAGQKSDVDIKEFLKKVDNKDFASMSVKELQLGIRLEKEVPGFGEKTGFKITSEAFALTNQFLNSAVIGAHDVLSRMKLSMGAGDPLGIATVGTNPDNPTHGIAHHPDTMNNLIADGKLDVTKFKQMADSGHLKSSLIFEPGEIPEISDMDKMSNSFEWLYANQERIATTTRRIDANNQFYLLKDVLGYDKPNYAPDKVADQDLEAYNSRMTEVLNTLFRVRNYGEAMLSLDNVDGDFNTDKAFGDLRTLGDFQLDPERKSFQSLTLRLPDDLIANAKNDRVLEGMRDWLKKYSAPVDQALQEFAKGNFIRYGDVHEKGTVGVDSNGKVVYIKDETGELTTVTTTDGKVINRSLDTSGYFYEDGTQETATRVKEIAARPFVTEKPFQYINQEFDSKDNGKYIDVENRRHYYQDHLLNYQNWFGFKQGDVGEKRRYEFDQYVGVQTQTGSAQLIRADRLDEFKMVQGFFHHGSKIASAALDVGMIVTGSIGARAAVTAGKGLYVATNAGRVMLGVGGLLDPTFRSMGETGETLRQARHIAILLDVTQGLGRQGLAKLTAGKLAFQSTGAAEVAKVIEESARMRRIETATRWAFGAADGVWLPLMGSEAHHKIQRLSGHDSFAYLDRANTERGSGLGDTSGKSFAGKEPEPVDIARASKTAFSVYRPLLGLGDDTAIFEKTQAALSGNDSDRTAGLRADLVGQFHPSTDSISQWKKSNGHNQAQIDRIKPGDLDVERNSSNTEKIATAISLLYLAQKDGQLPEDGVLARRQLTIPGYSYYVSGGGQGAPP
ncbi:MAG: hypothetical protein K8F91_23390, partial [Candidatus Obscuribacterales bacterium]|nr:hypothetical protein [Candidatus Obscuribacterales bacterium]